MNKKLDPCPFCGEKDDLFIESNGRVYSANCGKCKARGGWGYSIAEARSAWNMRPEDAL